MNLEKEIFDLELKDIMPNRFQPREVFDDDALQELSQSIKEHGVIQPIVVRKVGDKYEIIAGERRYRASLLAGKQTIPAMVSVIDDKEAAKVALIENLQRKDLTAIEEAKTYQTILKLDNMTQEELAQNLGKSQSAIANKLRLLNLDDEVQTALLNGEISERHARSLLNLPDRDSQKQMLNKIIANRMTVRQLDEEISNLTGKAIVDEQTDESINNTVVTNDIPQQSFEPTDNIATVNEPLAINVNKQNDYEKENLNNTPNIGISFNIPEKTNQTIESYYNNEPTEQPKEESRINIEPIKENQQEEIKTSSVFDSLRVKDESFDDNQASPETNESISPVVDIKEENNIIMDEPIKYDLRFAINNFRQAVQNTEKFGFKVEVVEADLAGSYQMVINIIKNKDE